MENISQSHESSTATLWPPHGLSPVKTLEAESVHEVVGGRGATLAAAASAEGGGWLGGGGAANAWLAAAELRPPTTSAELAAQRGACGRLGHCWNISVPTRTGRRRTARAGKCSPKRVTTSVASCAAALGSREAQRSTNSSSARARFSRVPSSLSSRLRRAFARLHQASSRTGRSRCPLEQGLSDLPLLWVHEFPAAALVAPADGVLEEIQPRWP